MRLNLKTIEELVRLIMKDITYRSGRQLVDFFNNLGFNDEYGADFPSRFEYTENRLKKINGTSQMVECLKELFCPINFVDNEKQLDSQIIAFNKYLAFDHFRIVRKNKYIEIIDLSFDNTKEVNISYQKLKTHNEEVLENYSKMHERLKNDDLKGAITSSRTLLECVFDDIHNIFLGVYAKRDAGNLSDQFKKIKNLLRFSPDSQSNNNIKLILQSFSSIITNFDQLTCAHSDRHKPNIPELPVNYHIANFCVNVSYTISTFLYELLDFKYGENIKLYDNLIKYLEEDSNRLINKTDLIKKTIIKKLLEIIDNGSGKILIEKLIKEYEIPSSNGYYKSDVFFKALEILEDYIIKEHITSIFKKYKNNNQACGLLFFLKKMELKKVDVLNKKVKDYLKDK